MSHSSRKSSQDVPMPPRVRYQNTYRTDPTDDSKFYAYKIEPRIYATLESHLKDKTYNPNKSLAMSKELSEEIMRETRNCLSHNARYKLISHVSIGQQNGQDIRCTSRCLWDTNFDRFVSVVYKNDSLFAVATLFAVYYE
jgi:hypothetical protein